jgi:hypothetical protein
MICITNVFFKNNTDPDLNPDPDPKLRSIRIRIRKKKTFRIHNTVEKTSPSPSHLLPFVNS